MMGKRKKRRPIEVSKWLEFAAKKTVLYRIQRDPYSVAYTILAVYFDSLPALDWDAAVRGLHIVYAWMPTIPRLGKIMGWDSDRQDELVAALDVVRINGEPTQSQLELIRAFCNNSMVGASKLMHFLSPQNFPIWDSRVAKTFLKRPGVTGASVNIINRWDEYRRTMLGWAKDTNVKWQCEKLRKNIPRLEQASDIRLMELVLFHKTASKRLDQLA